MKKNYDEDKQTKFIMKSRAMAPELIWPIIATDVNMICEKIMSLRRVEYNK